MPHVWVIEHVDGDSTESGFDGWSVGYVEEGRYLSLFQTWDETWAEKLVASLELYEAAMELPNYERLPIAREVTPKKKTRTRA